MHAKYAPLHCSYAAPTRVSFAAVALRATVALRAADTAAGLDMGARGATADRAAFGKLGTRVATTGVRGAAERAVCWAGVCVAVRAVWGVWAVRADSILDCVCASTTGRAANKSHANKAASKSAGMPFIII